MVGDWFYWGGWGDFVGGQGQQGSVVQGGGCCYVGQCEWLGWDCYVCFICYGV